jgi:hypothetical protein
MTWSYSGDPNDSNLDAVRFHVQDTIQADQQVSNEEIEYLLDQEGDNVLRAAARTAEIIAAKYARQVDKSVGGLSLSAGRRQEHYDKLADMLWGRAKGTGTSGATYPAVPYVGGISVSGKIAIASDPDRVDPIFRKDLHEFNTNPDLDVNT